jgi:hypothetical protein
MDLRETTWSQGSRRLRCRHRHYLLAHLLRNNQTTIRVNGAPAIMMMTSLPIHLSNHSPQALERNLSGRCNHQRRNENDQHRKRQWQIQMKKQKGLYRKKSRTYLKKRKKEENSKNWRPKNEGRTERLNAFIHDKETKRRRKPPLKTDYQRSVDKSYAKKKQRGLPNSYIEQIPASTSGTATTDKNKEIPASTSGTAAQTRTRRFLRRCRGPPETSSKYLHPRPIRLTCLRASLQKCKTLLRPWVKNNWLRSLAF